MRVNLTPEEVEFIMFAIFGLYTEHDCGGRNEIVSSIANKLKPTEQ
jgi:hypothetical protein